MKIKIIEQNTAFCIVLTVVAVILTVFSFYTEGLTSVALSIIALILVLWSVYAWPHDQVYKIIYRDKDDHEIHEMKCFVSIRFSEKQRQHCINTWVPGEVLHIEELEEVAHCPFRFRAIGHL